MAMGQYFVHRRRVPFVCGVDFLKSRGPCWSGGPGLFLTCVDEELLHLLWMIKIKLHQAQYVKVRLTPRVNAACPPEIDFVIPSDNGFVAVS